MSGEAGQNGTVVSSVDLILGGFSQAQSVAEEVIESILEEGGIQLYQSYVEKKVFSFASEGITNLLVSELQLCFVRHDEGEPCIPRCPSHRVNTCNDLRPMSALSAQTQATLQPSELGQPSDLGQPEEVDPALEQNFSEVSQNSYQLELEPNRCRIDTWARACVPVIRKLVRPQSKPINEQLRKPLASRNKYMSSHSSSSRSPSRTGQIASGQSPLQALESISDTKGGKNLRDGMIPLNEPVVEDEEETAMREMKEREAKRKREEDNRLQRKAAEEVDEATRLAQVKDQMKNKPYSYDSSGNIIWVQALHAEKLPSAYPVPQYSLKQEPTLEERIERKTPRSLNYRNGNDKKPQTKAREAEFVDTFKKFTSQQPPMMETMKMAAGVKLNERGAMKNGEDVVSSSFRQSRTPMTRQQYEAVSKSGQWTDASKLANVQESESLVRESGNVATTLEAQTTSEVASRAPTAKEGAVGQANMKAVSSSEPGLVPQPPPTPRSGQPIPLPSVRRLQLKRDALGYFAQSTRERVATGTGSRFPACAAPPILGATMGHGLAPQGHKYDEYYFPNAVSPGLLFGSDGGDPPSPLGTTQAKDGLIVSKNPDLMRRLLFTR